MKLNHHGCPRRGCQLVISDVLFCCASDWYALPLPVRIAIRQTARLSILAKPRRAAILAARAAWDELDAR